MTIENTKNRIDTDFSYMRKENIGFVKTEIDEFEKQIRAIFQSSNSTPITVLYKFNDDNEKKVLSEYIESKRKQPSEPDIDKKAEGEAKSIDPEEIKKEQFDKVISDIQNLKKQDVKNKLLIQKPVITFLAKDKTLVVQIHYEMGKHNILSHRLTDITAEEAHTKTQEIMKEVAATGKMVREMPAMNQQKQDLFVVGPSTKLDDVIIINTAKKEDVLDRIRDKINSLELPRSRENLIFKVKQADKTSLVVYVQNGQQMLLNNTFYTKAEKMPEVLNKLAEYFNGRNFRSEFSTAETGLRELFIENDKSKKKIRKDIATRKNSDNNDNVGGGLGGGR